jgi:2-polyprenyl-3-methyl-5-hydroxy-6-metoxy-1,4-benzoquinol methylase
MALRIDPEENELRALRRAASWRRKNVLEIGCGEGRLTLRLARLGVHQVTAIDPDRRLITKARSQRPTRLSHRITYRVGKAEELRFPNASFDLVIFSWSF